MYLTPEQIVGANKASMEALLGLASTQYAAFERLSTLNTNAAKAVFEEGLVRAKSLLGAKDAQEYFTLNAAANQPSLEKAIAYSRSVYEVAAQTQGEIAKFVEARAAEFSKNLLGMLDKASKNAPAGSDVAVTALKSTVAATTAAFDQLSKATKQVVNFADASVRAATANAANVAKAATKGRKAA